VCLCALTFENFRIYIAGGTGHTLGAAGGIEAVVAVKVRTATH